MSCLFCKLLQTLDENQFLESGLIDCLNFKYIIVSNSNKLLAGHQNQTSQKRVFSFAY